MILNRHGVPDSPLSIQPPIWVAFFRLRNADDLYIFE